MTAYLDPWHPACGKSALERQLQAELPDGHALSGLGVTALAQRQDCDDVLFSLDDGSGRVAVVHLTWSQNTDARWPQTEFYASLSAWANERMPMDHETFNASRN